MGLCQEPNCRREAKKGNFCHCHSKRRYRQKYPIKAAFQNLRTNARRRGKEFLLTFEQFEAFCQRTQYMTGKGRTKDSFTIDRRRNDEGYSVENIQIMTLSENSTKRMIVDYDWESRVMRYRPAVHADFEDAPF
jgi:hypothetical protein